MKKKVSFFCPETVEKMGDFGCCQHSLQKIMILTCHMKNMIKLFFVIVYRSPTKRRIVSEGLHGLTKYSAQLYTLNAQQLKK